MIQFRSILLLVLLAVFQSASAQFEYFNQVVGESGDMNVQSHENIERIENNYVLWGGGIEFDTVYYDYLKLDETGSIIASSEFSFPYEFLYTGVTTSFNKIPFEEAFLMSHAKEDTISMKGFLMKLDSSLDTLWTREYDFFPYYTYFYTHVWDEDGFVIAGEYRQNAMQQRGTFIAKVDLQGELLWYEVLHEPGTGGFRNTDISVFNDGYILSGGSGSGALTTGRIAYFREDEPLIESEGWGGDLRLIMRHIIKSDGQIIVAQAVSEVDYPNSSDPLWNYRYIRLYEFNAETGELIHLNDVMEGQQWLNGFPIKLIEVDDGLVLMGNFRKVIGSSEPIQSYIMKLDENYEQIWYTELAYQPGCTTCKSQLYDMELAPDGGYTMVGAFSDQATDAYDKTWLVKVDACGDLEWQGCENPDGLWESGSSARLGDLTLFPNPYPAGSSAPLGVRFPQEVVVARVVIADALGRFKDLRFEIDSDGNLKSHISNLKWPAGLYSLLITTKDGSVYSGKVIIE